MDLRGASVASETQQYASRDSAARLRVLAEAHRNLEHAEPNSITGQVAGSRLPGAMLVWQSLALEAPLD